MASEGLSVLYFPYIDMEEGPLREMILYFKRITFLRPSFWTPSAVTEKFQAEGIVESRAPIKWDLDNRQVQRMLKEFESLVAIYQDSGYLEYLKHGTLPFQDDERCHQIISEIRQYKAKGMSGDVAEEEEIDLLRGQLLLQLAQELEKQRQELLGLYQELIDKEDDVSASLGEGVKGIEENKGPLTPTERQIPDKLKPEEDDFMIAERLIAWNEMYHRIDSEACLLFTDNRFVVQYMSGGPEDFDQTASADPLIQEVAALKLPLFRPGPVEEYLRAREMVRKLPEWRAFEKELLQLFSSIEEGLWDKGTMRRLLALGYGLSRFATETLTDSIIEGVHRHSRLTLDPLRSLILKVFVLPGRKPERILNLLCGGRSLTLESGPGNGRFLLVYHGGAIAREI